MRKWLWVVLVVALAALTAGAVTAQDSPPVVVYCQGLTEADCALLTDSAVLMRDLRSAAVQLDVNASISGIPDVKGALGVRATGQGAYAITDPSLLTALADPTVVELASTDPTAYLKQLIGLLRAFSADLDLTLTFSQDMQTLAAADGTDLPERVGLSARLLEGVGYLNLSKLSALDPSGELPQGWIGMDVATAAERALEAQTIPPTAGAGTPLSTADQMELGQRYVTVERQADVVIDNQDAAVFVMTFDMAGLLADQTFIDLIAAQVRAQGQELSDRELQQALLFARLFAGNLKLSASQTIALESRYTLQSTVSVDWPLDVGAFMGAVGENNPPTEPLYIQLQMQVDYRDFDAVAPITAPEGAQMADLEDMLGS